MNVRYFINSHNIDKIYKAYIIELKASNLMSKQKHLSQNTPVVFYLSQIKFNVQKCRIRQIPDTSIIDRPTSDI